MTLAEERVSKQATKNEESRRKERERGESAKKEWRRGVQGSR